MAFFYFSSVISLLAIFLDYDDVRYLNSLLLNLDPEVCRSENEKV